MKESKSFQRVLVRKYELAYYDVAVHYVSHYATVCVCVCVGGSLITLRL